MTITSSGALTGVTGDLSFSMYDEPPDVRRRRQCQDDEFRQKPCQNDLPDDKQSHLSRMWQDFRKKRKIW